MTASLITPAVLGLDGFAVCVALGPLGFGIWRSMPLVGLFGLCDGLALLAGGAFHPSPWNGAVVPAMAAVWAVLVLLLTIKRTPSILPLLPVLLAFDNLLAGTEGSRTVLLEDAVLSCAISATLAGVGLLAGNAVAARLAPQLGHARIAGAGLLLVVGVAGMAG
jgi:hypothetical protein